MVFIKLIGIVGRSYYNKDNQKIIQVHEDVRKILCRYDDVSSILILPTNNLYYTDLDMGMDILDDNDRSKLDYVLDICDGFIVPGGSRWYKFDEYVINYAINKNKPLLGICLGFQILCSMFSKNRISFDMTKRLESNNHYDDKYKYVHSNFVFDDTKLKDILGKDKIMVNSVHHDYVDLELLGLKKSSVSSDGVLEAVEFINKDFIVGVQWHPECIMDDNSIKLFDSFIEYVKC